MPEFRDRLCAQPHLSILRIHIPFSESGSIWPLSGLATHELKDANMKIIHTCACAFAFAAVVSFSSAPVIAQTPAAPAATPAATATPAAKGKTQKANTRQQRTAKSLECSKQADTQNIHGRQRRTFMNKCKKA